MRHGDALRRLNRNAKQRAILVKQLCSHLFLHDRVQTTLARAKVLAVTAERILRLAVAPPKPENETRIAASVATPGIAARILGELRSRYAALRPPLVRVWPLGPRPSDKAPVAVVELRGGPHDMQAAFERYAAEARAGVRGHAAKTSRLASAHEARRSRCIDIALATPPLISRPLR